MPVSWILLPMNVYRTDWLHRLPWKLFILVASYIFLGYHQPQVALGSISIPLPCLVLASSIIGNYFASSFMMNQTSARAKKYILSAIIACNIGGLAYFKYKNFVIIQAHHIVGNAFVLPRLTSLIIPIAISFLRSKQFLTLSIVTAEQSKKFRSLISLFTFRFSLTLLLVPLCAQVNSFHKCATPIMHELSKEHARQL